MSVLLTIVTVAAFDHSRLKLTIESTLELPSSVEHVFIIPEQDEVSRQILEDALNQGKQLKIAHDSNSGVYSAMNLGVIIASGEYVIFWNSGDLMYSNSELEFFITEIEASKPTWAIARGVLEGGVIHENSLQDVWDFRNQKLGSYISHQVIACNRRVMFDLGLFDQRYRVAADTKLIQILTRLNQPLISSSKIVYIETPQYSARFHRRSRYETAKLAFLDLLFYFQMKPLLNVIMRELKFLRKLLVSFLG